jgi:hypothetical protein
MTASIIPPIHPSAHIDNTEVIKNIIAIIATSNIYIILFNTHNMRSTLANARLATIVLVS